MNRIILLAAAAAICTTGEARAQATASGAEASLPSAGGDPAPAPDAARLWHGTVVYRVSVRGDTTGADTATWAMRGGKLSAVDHMHLLGSAAAVEARMALPSLAPVSETDVRQAGGRAVETRLAYEDGRVHGTMSVGAQTVPIDAETPVGTYDWAGLAPVIAALPLRAGARWTLPAYSPYVRAVAPFTADVGAVETVDTPMGPVRVFRVRVTGGPAEMLYWFSEAEPRWEVRGEIPALGITIEARSRTP